MASGGEKLETIDDGRWQRERENWNRISAASTSGPNQLPGKQICPEEYKGFLIGVEII